MEDVNWTRMIRRQIVGRGIRDERVIAAMSRVDRRQFVPDSAAADAFADRPLPIGFGQTISQPYMVALMAESLQLTPSDRVLEIGTGCGYAAAVLAELADTVWTIERIERLAARAAATLDSLGYDRVHVCVGDGSLGLPDDAPFDAIVAAASGPHIPQAWIDQLAVGGRMVLPVGTGSDDQSLIRLTRLENGTMQRETLTRVRFVPLIGEFGWPEP